MNEYTLMSCFWLCYSSWADCYDDRWTWVENGGRVAKVEFHRHCNNELMERH